MCLKELLGLMRNRYKGNRASLKGWVVMGSKRVWMRDVGMIDCVVLLISFGSEGGMIWAKEMTLQGKVPQSGQAQPTRLRHSNYSSHYYDHKFQFLCFRDPPQK